MTTVDKRKPVRLDPRFRELVRQLSQRHFKLVELDQQFLAELLKHLDAMRARLRADEDKGSSP